MLHICNNCGKQFEGQKRAKFCSISCALSGTVIRKTLKCVDCGTLFEFIGRTTKKRCDTCWKKHRTETVMKSRHKKHPQVQVGVGSGHSYQNPNTPILDARKEAELRSRRQRYHRNKIIKVTEKTYRKLMITGHDRCSICGYDRYQQALVVHHIDMNRRNNQKENLLILCCNCHSVLHNRIRQQMKSGEFKFNFQQIIQSLKLQK